MANLSCKSLGDRDDDVRSVAASCLLPVAGLLVEHLAEALNQVLMVLWSSLSHMKDDLSSSVGAVMELLGESLSDFCCCQSYVKSKSREACYVRKSHRYVCWRRCFVSILNYTLR